jgi:quinol monooxygenase YgiN
MPELQVIAHHRMKEGAESEVFALLPGFIEMARAEPGNVTFDAYRDFDDPQAYVLLERYRSREAFAEHRGTAHFQDVLLGRIVPLLESRTIEAYDVPEDGGHI